METIKRRSGTTTRFVDHTIQNLFNLGEINVPTTEGIGITVFKDYIEHSYKKNNLAQKDFIYRLIKRIQLEHPESIKITKNDLYINFKVKNGNI